MMDSVMEHFIRGKQIKWKAGGYDLVSALGLGTYIDMNIRAVLETSKCCLL
jgi:hypothetical protein